MDRHIAACAFTVLVGVVGCGQSGEPTATTPAPSDVATNNSATTAQNANDMGRTPQEAVIQFLEAVRVGNDETAAAMLTPTARQKTAEVDLAVAPPGSPTAKFTVEEKVDYVTPNKDGAHVFSVWTDVDEEGKEQTQEIIWVLRKETEGWRIVGSVAKVFADEEPLLLNFENPQEMKRKLELLEQEYEARLQVDQTPADQPQATRRDPESPVAR